MFIVTTKVSKGKAAAVFVGICVLIAVCIIMVSVAKSGDVDAFASSDSQKVEVSYKNIKENGDRITFLNAFGWEVKEDPVAIEEIVIPEEFNEIYEEYNELQKSQDLDLTKYQGKTVRRYTYEVLNYPKAEETVYANLLIYKNRVIGGNICSSQYKGFMHGFLMP